MPITPDCNQETADSLRRGAAAAAARGLVQLAEVLRQRAIEIEGGHVAARKAA